MRKDVSAEHLRPAPAPLSATRCKALRERLGWSPEQLAQAAGIAALTVLSFERGERIPREQTLIAIRRAFRNAPGPAPDRLSGCALPA